MRNAFLSMIVITISASVSLPSHAASPQVCKGHDEGFEVLTDCYGMTLTGVALRNAQVRELVASRKSVAEIASVLDIRITTLPSSHQACPPGTVQIPQVASFVGGLPEIVDIHCVH